MPYRLFMFTADPRVRALGEAAAAQLRAPYAVTSDPAALARALDSRVPIFIGDDLIGQALDVVRTIDGAVLDRSPSHRTAVGARLPGLLDVGLHHVLGPHKATDVQVDAQEVPDPGQVARVTAWLRDQLPALFDPDQLPGAFPYSSGVPTPEGTWRYLLDTAPISYGPGLWPFYRPGIAEQCLAGLRMSPSTEHYAWGNEYVSLSPSFWSNDIAEAGLHLYCGFDGARHWVYNGKIRLLLSQDAAEIHPEIPDTLRDQAQQKADKLLAAIIVHRAARDSGVTVPLTAWRHFHPDAP